MVRRGLCLALLILPFASIASIAAGQKVTMDLESLEVVPGVLVVAEGVTADAEADGLRSDALVSDIEAMLREAGIPVLTDAQWRDLIGNPLLQLTLTLLKPSPHLYLYSGNLEVRQLTVLVRDSTKAAFTRTWSGGAILGTKPTAQIGGLRQEIRGMVERFIEDYQDAVRRAGPAPWIPRRARVRTTSWPSG